jgi:malate dehydrogenase (quinone)
MDAGTDVNFGELTRAMFRHLALLNGVKIFLNHDVKNLQKNDLGSWTVETEDSKTEQTHLADSKFVFIGAGGGSLPLLEKSDITEGKGFGGFPVGGQWLVCNNKSIIEKHSSKVYGVADVGAPPMSVPHLDTRIINGKRALLFGPFAGFSTKFLKHGSVFDLPASIQLDNIKPMISAGLNNLPLTKYLIDQVRLTPESRLQALQKYVPTATLEDWDLLEAGQRVQVIKKDEEEGGILEFGTELVTAADGSIAALLGASPGASVSASVMIQVLERCFQDKFTGPEWQKKLKEIIPTYGESLNENEQMCDSVRDRTSKILGLNEEI